MTAAGRVALSFLCGVLLTAATTAAGMAVESRVVARVLMWQVMLLSLLHDALLGPGPVLYHDAQGRPVYEGTPVMFFVFGLGVLMGVPIYTCLSYAVLGLRERRRRNRLR